MARYRVLDGTHVGSGDATKQAAVTYTTGEEFDDDADNLDEIFPNKLLNIDKEHERLEQQRGKARPQKMPNDRLPTDSRGTEKKKREEAAAHEQEEEAEEPPRQIVKGRRRTPDVGAAAGERDKDESQVQRDEAERQRNAPKGPRGRKLGKDVTDDFPKAESAGLKVFKGPKNKFHVTEAEAQDVALNEEPLSKAELNKFVGTIIKEDKGKGESDEE